MRRVPEAAIQRLVDVVWFLSVAGVAGSSGSPQMRCTATGRGHGPRRGVGITLYSAALWLARQHALQNLALFTGLILTVCSIIFTVDSSAPSLSSLWCCGGSAWRGPGVGGGTLSRCG
jgi:hypothetical protein